jgi:hypothetical protein
MSLLAGIHGSRGPQAHPSRAAAAAGPGDPRSPHRVLLRHGRAHRGLASAWSNCRSRSSTSSTPRPTRSSGTSGTRPTRGSSSPGATRSSRRSGPPGGSRASSSATRAPHDQFGAGHAGTAMSAALGMATARDLKGEDYKVVAVVGDGAMTCGLTYEGMNNAGHSDRDILLIVNDNGMSSRPTSARSASCSAASWPTRAPTASASGSRRSPSSWATSSATAWWTSRRTSRSRSRTSSARDAVRGARLPLLRPDRRARPAEAARHAGARARSSRAPRPARPDPEGEGLHLRRGEPREVARPRGLRSGDGRGAEEGERPRDLDAGVRRHADGHRRRA